MEPKELQPDTSFKFCKKEIKTFKEDLLCQQDEMYKSMVDNPLGFIIFYVFSIIFIAFLFQLSQKGSKKKGKKNN